MVERSRVLRQISCGCVPQPVTRANRVMRWPCSILMTARRPSFSVQQCVCSACTAPCSPPASSETNAAEGLRWCCCVEGCLRDCLQKEMARVFVEGCNINVYGFGVEGGASPPRVLGRISIP